MAKWKDTSNFFDLLEDIEQNSSKSCEKNKAVNKSTSDQERNRGAVPKRLRNRYNSSRSSVNYGSSDQNIQEKNLLDCPSGSQLKTHEEVNSSDDKRDIDYKNYQNQNTNISYDIKYRFPTVLNGTNIKKSTLYQEGNSGAMSKGVRNKDNICKSTVYNDSSGQNKQQRNLVDYPYESQQKRPVDVISRNDKRDRNPQNYQNKHTNTGFNIEYQKENKDTDFHYPATRSVLDENNIQRFNNKFPYQEIANTSQYMQNKSHDRWHRTFGYKRLLQLSNNEINEIIVTVANPKTCFQNLFEEKLGPDFVLLIMKVLGKVCSSEFLQLKSSILSSASNPIFLEQITNYIGKLPTEDNPERKLKIVLFVNDLLTFLVALIDIFPTTACERLKKIIIAIDISMKGIEKHQSIYFSKETFDVLEIVCNKFSALETEKKEQNAKGKSAFDQKGQFLKPPDNFRNISIIPTFKDLFTSSKDIYLRRNIVKGSYENIDHYLDVQFRLLREDFIGPLREGIQEYIKDPDRKQKISNIRVYSDIIFLHGVRNKNKCGYEVSFDSFGKLTKVNWEYSKRFMFGSLLLFTNDNFKTFFFGTVSDREIKKLKEGLITVEITQGTELPVNLFTESYLMVESEVYFEPYFHVLSALQVIQPETFPMEKYIVYVDSDNSLPEYFSRTNYNWNIFNYEVNILDQNSWPSSDNLGLDPSQYTAFKAALTNEFVAIQGPPGTGKTHIGLMISEVLLKNLKTINNFGPLLVICYTNHALDQFLEGLLSHTDSIIRIGGQSRSEILQNYNLKEVRRNRERSDIVDVTICCRNLHNSMQNVLTEITYQEKNLEEVLKFNGILSVETIQKFMTANQRDLLSEYNLYDNWLTEEAYLKEMYPETVPNSNNILDSTQISSDYKTDEFIPPLLHTEHVNSTDTLSTDTSSTEQVVFDNNIVDEESEGDEEHYQRLTNEINIYDLEWKLLDVDLKNDDLIFVSRLEKMKTECFLQRKIFNELMEKVYISHTEISPLEIQFEHDKLRELNVYYQYVDMRLGEIRNINKSELQNIKNDDVWQLDYSERWRLYRWWVEKYIISVKIKIQNLEVKYRELKLQYEELKQMEDLLFVCKADVVGITTTGAARVRSMLNKLKAKVVIVEEAAEVLEAHIVTSITKDCQHVILIGDHEQLRPSTAVFKLARYYNMDISLFERMQGNGLGCYKLGVQHRMRPEIASLIVPTIYKELENHPLVENRPNIKGITHNLFFLTHTQPEDEVPDSASRRNKHEADFMIALCRHLLLQGYTANEITILATYSGQMQYMMREKRKNSLFKEVRITVVDKFQGEENRIILLSLVRSNKLGKIGFLSTKNRVCVALSRAKEGLFIIGNMNNLEERSTIWNEIKGQLEKGHHIGPDLTLRCEIHQNYLTRVKQASDFLKVPQGGCDLICDEELICGHRCTSICHIIDREHIHHKCIYPCMREICSIEGHDCPKLCWEACDLCQRPIEKELPCGHSAKLPCYKNPEEQQCLVEMDAVLPACGHKITKPCFADLNSFGCSYDCEDRLPCGHKCELKCHKLEDPDHIEYKCKKDCTRNIMKCTSNHTCNKRCYEDCGECSTLMKRELPCGHFQDVMCSVDVNSILCMKRCKKILPCLHPCKRQCCNECGGCKEPVDKILPECKHIQKSVACSDEPNPQRCSKPCNRTLKCGHLCKRLCNQVCDDGVCLEIIETSEYSPCGHKVSNFECYLRDEPEELVLFCKSPCKKLLPCGHKCQGDCSSCIELSSVIIHAPCKEKCGKKLVCGHMCVALCREICPPCNQQCLYECEHKSCTKRCGEFCDPCYEKCNRSCPHSTCVKKCFEICSIEKCNERCYKFLQCGHTCSGLCGEVCPTCPICNGSSDYGYTRYLQLEDCGCNVDVQNLDRLFDTDNYMLHKSITLNHCPNFTCQKPIIKTKRYKNLTLKLFKDIGHIKRKVISQLIEITKPSKKLLRDIEESLVTQRNDVIKICNHFVTLLMKSLARATFIKTQPTKHYALMIVAGSFYNMIRANQGSMTRRLIKIFEQRMDYIDHDDILKLKTILNRSGFEFISDHSLRNTIVIDKVWFICGNCTYVISNWSNEMLKCYNCNKLEQEVMKNMRETNSLIGNTSGRLRSQGGRRGRGRGNRGRRGGYNARR